MAWRRAALASVWFLRSSASMRCLVTGSVDSSALHSGQRLAKPGLSGFSSNSSEQMAQTLIGNGILSMIKPTSWGVYPLRGVYTGFALGLPLVGYEVFFVASVAVKSL